MPSRKKEFYKTKLGKYYLGHSDTLLANELYKTVKGKVQLLFTSPPFPLNKKKKYGNLKGEDYKQWFAGLAELFSDMLAEDGSIVIELGNAWESKRPVQSLLHLESLISFVRNPKANLRLCQQFVCYNPSRLPSPAQWVTIERIRTIDSFTHVWWMAKSDYPKANNNNILRPYSDSMKSLLKRKSFNSGIRPSEHRISEKGFLKRHKGSISHNLIEIEPIKEDKPIRLPINVLSIANTRANDYFMKACKEKGITPHPARMPLDLAAYFIAFLTEPGDLVLDPFAGSNTTGYCAEKLNRRWISIEVDKEYGKQSVYRFNDPELNSKVSFK
ncbi:pvuii dna methyltransferase [hydrocarbon metagenome]|uniref:site-specific DNA-methyltransferase (cytosine-N(4)-specific) n=1 Tax=hydrocarbon metagenome TaxID=938273 RepID=A0A0W8FTQ3_9ZZZZ